MNKLSRRFAICSVNASAYSETFIKAHTELLAGEKYVLYGSYKPLYYNGQSLVKLLPLHKRILYKFFGKKELIDYAIEYFLKSRRIELLFAEYGPTGCAILNIAKKLHLPLIVHFHGYDATSSKVLTEYADRYKEMFRYSGSLISVSLHMKARLLELGAPEHKLKYNPYGPAVKFKDVVPDYDKSESALFIGRFVDKKAPYLLIEVLSSVVEKGHRIRLIMAGDGPLLETCKVLVRVKGLENYVTFPGAVDHSGVKKLMSESFCYIQHSVTTGDGETEGTPVSILEAQQAGLPVISTYHAGIPDVVIHNETGFLVEEFDINKMADYLIVLFTERKLAREMGNRARLRIEEHFSLERHIRFLDQEIERLLNEH